MFPETVPTPNYSAPLLNFKTMSPGQQQPATQPQQSGFLPRLPNGQIDFRKIATDLQSIGKTAGGVAQGIGQGIGSLAQGVGQGANAAVSGIGNGIGALLGL